MVTASRLSAIGEMAAAITHEINNPLGVILGRCEMLKKELESEKISVERLLKNIVAIESTGQRIEKIIKSMKLLAYDGEQEDFVKVKISEIISDTMDLCLERFKNRGIKLMIESQDENLYLYCIPHQIVQVLVNLLNNAYDAIENSQVRWIKVEIKNLDNKIEILITDSGNGIDEELSRKIFQPFYSTKRAKFGTGLGLSVSKSILLKHKGDLVLDRSNPNTSFRLIFPATN